jgi:hypothetical protein
MFVAQALLFALVALWLILGMAIAESAARINTTIRSSTNVTPFLFIFIAILYSPNFLKILQTFCPPVVYPTLSAGIHRHFCTFLFFSA